MVTMATPPLSRKQKIENLGVQLGGVKEVASALGVPVTNVTTWMSRRASNKCPAAVAELAMGSVFDVNEWRSWHSEFTNQRPRRTRQPATVDA